MTSLGLPLKGSPQAQHLAAKARAAHGLPVHGPSALEAHALVVQELHRGVKALADAEAARAAIGMLTIGLGCF